MAMAKAAVAVIIVAGLVEARVAISGAVMVGLFFTAMQCIGVIIAIVGIFLFKTGMPN